MCYRGAVRTISFHCVILLAGAAGLPLASCGPTSDDAATQNETVTKPRISSLPVLEPPLDRAGMILAMARSASATALGEEDRAAQRQLDGKRFEVRVRFGCPAGGARPEEERSGTVSFDEDTRTLRLSVAPNVASDDPWIETLGGEGVEAVEGFWLRRPWLLSAGCPSLPDPPTEPAEPTELQPRDDQARRRADPEADAPPAAVATPRVGIAQFFTESDPRGARRDKRAYDVTKTLDATATPSAQGYDLVLSGRLRKLPDGRVISCRMRAADLPPDCVTAAEFSRVWIEEPATREVLAQWGR